jgi:phosphate starvation-inducible protein PhoH
VARRPSPARKVLTFESDADNAELANVTGPLDANLRQIETELDVSIGRRGHQFRVEVNQQYRTRWFELLMVHQADHGSLPIDNAKDPPPLGRLSPA